MQYAIHAQETITFYTLCSKHVLLYNVAQRQQYNTIHINSSFTRIIIPTIVNVGGDSQTSSTLTMHLQRRKN